MSSLSSFVDLSWPYFKEKTHLNPLSFVSYVGKLFYPIYYTKNNNLHDEFKDIHSIQRIYNSIFDCWKRIFTLWKWTGKPNPFRVSVCVWKCSWYMDFFSSALIDVEKSLMKVIFCNHDFLIASIFVGTVRLMFVLTKYHELEKPDLPINENYIQSCINAIECNEGV